MAQKKYRAISDFQYRTGIDVGNKRIYITFEGGVKKDGQVINGFFSTKDVELQKAIESSPSFNKRFLLVEEAKEIATKKEAVQEAAPVVIPPVGPTIIEKEVAPVIIEGEGTGEGTDEKTPNIEGEGTGTGEGDGTGEGTNGNQLIALEAENKQLAIEALVGIEPELESKLNARVTIAQLEEKANSLGYTFINLIKK